MTGYVDYNLTVDPQQVAAAALAEWISRGYSGDETDPGTALIETIATRNAQTRALLVDFARAAYRDFGIKVHGVAFVEAASATLTTTWVAADSDGHTIPAGSRAAYPLTGDTSVLLETTAEATIDVGGTTLTGVEMQVVTVGVAGNGLAASTVLTAVDAYSWLTSITTTSASSGGEDAETAGAYLDRLAAELTLFSRVPRLEGEFAQVALRIAGVERSRGIRGYDADLELADQPGHVTVVVTDVDGAAVSAGIKTLVETELESDDRRALNVVVHVVDPTSVAVAVNFVAVALVGYDPVVVEAAAVAAVETWLDPATWQADGVGGWGSETIVRYQELSHLLHSVEGFDRWTTLTIDAGVVDVDLAVGGDIAPLPDATVTGSVS